MLFTITVVCPFCDLMFIDQLINRTRHNSYTRLNHLNRKQNTFGAAHVTAGVKLLPQWTFLEVTQSRTRRKKIAGFTGRFSMMYVVKLQFKFEKIQALRIGMEFIDKQRLSSVYKHFFLLFQKTTQYFGIFQWKLGWTFLGLTLLLPLMACSMGGPELLGGLAYPARSVSARLCEAFIVGTPCGEEGSPPRPPPCSAHAAHALGSFRHGDRA